MSYLTIESFPVHGHNSQLLKQWIFEVIIPYVKGTVLEMNSAATLAPEIQERGFTVHLNAGSEIHRDELRGDFANSPLVGGIHKINFLTSRMETHYLDLQEQFSTVLAFRNFTEPEFYDETILRKAIRFLRPGGHFIVIAQSQVGLYPQAQQDNNDLLTFNRAAIRTALPGCEYRFTRFFDWGKLCFLAAGRKLDSLTQ
jgi:SAM-dependent methyltransferase